METGLHAGPVARTPSHSTVNIEHIPSKGHFFTRSHLSVAKNVLTEVFRDAQLGDTGSRQESPS